MDSLETIAQNVQLSDVSCSGNAEQRRVYTTLAVALLMRTSIPHTLPRFYCTWLHLTQQVPVSAS
ncbi:hypothetical protein PROFUN_12427 [Planoprotostelium fungivorum]|uniref:Uncharacterized protein n=1 Tax=Planoprotostelium fungivorum TaxID=1890364 RepID=A0A2P6N5P7_9EUKA|nr:hypothetical protein PROFUN_12427 [Planoprotostelium fungivorum]